MKHITKFLSSVLALLMLASVFAALPVTASAQTNGDYEYVVLEDGTASITKYIGSDSALTIPRELDGYSVTVIGEKAFLGQIFLESVIIPDSVTALKKGKANITVTVGKTKLTYRVNVTTSPKLSKKSVSVKKNKTVTVKITGKASGVNNKYTNTKYAKVKSKKSANTLKIKGLKRGKTTLKIKVNGVTLKLKVTIT